MTASATDDRWLNTLRQALMQTVPRYIHQLDHSTTDQLVKIVRASTTAARSGALESGNADARIVVNTIARGLAASARLPGGVTYLGVHWCTGSDHSAGLDAVLVCDAPRGPCRDEADRIRRRLSSPARATTPSWRQGARRPASRHEGRHAYRQR